MSEMITSLRTTTTTEYTYFSAVRSIARWNQLHYIDKPAKMDYIPPESGSLIACLIKG
jgi:hypothetical protein